MKLWHLTPDAPRHPLRVSADETVRLRIGTWPIEPGQSVRITFLVLSRDFERTEGVVAATWRHNEGPNSYWDASVGPFMDGDHVTYQVRGSVERTEVVGPTATFCVGPKLYLALLWHQHQPIYKDMSHDGARESYLHPWVRLHALRDYYSMASMVKGVDRLHLTVNLSGSLLWQLRDYAHGGATDRALELTRATAENLTASETEYVLSRFFDADWHNQIAVHPRYAELFVQRREKRPFSAQDVRDLQMWFNLVWFGKEFRESEVELVAGETVLVHELVKKGESFTTREVNTMVSEQYKILRAVVPMHRWLQDRGRIEVTTTPFAHPILPLIVDTDQATIDRPGASRPTRFHRPDDAAEQVELAIELYRESFGRPPAGMWPAEGAVSASTVPIYARRGVRWIATDEGVLAQSGRWGYEVSDAEVVCRPYRATVSGDSLSVFFRATDLSNAIGFDYQGFTDSAEAAADFVRRVKEQYANRLSAPGDYLLPVILDGENAWGSYRDDGRPFLQALYRLLADDAEIETVSFLAYLNGNEARGIEPHPTLEQREVHELFSGSWIDEAARRPASIWGPGSVRTRRTVHGSSWRRRACSSMRKARHLSRHPPRTRLSMYPRGVIGSGGLDPIRTREETTSSTISFVCI